MPERFTGDARQVVVCASEQARRLGHGFIGGEHLLYGLASAGGEVGAVLRERGVTPERVEAEFVRLIGPENTASGSLFDTLDRDALTTIGIDLDTVRERIEAVFGRPPSPRTLRRHAGGDDRAPAGARPRHRAHPAHPPGEEMPREFAARGPSALQRPSRCGAHRPRAPGHG